MSLGFLINGSNTSRSQIIITNLSLPTPLAIGLMAGFLGKAGSFFFPFIPFFLSFSLTHSTILLVYQA